MTCDVCNGFDEGNTCCPPANPSALERYTYAVIPYGKVSCALSLLALWDRPWSSTAQRWCVHVLQRARNRGCVVFE